MNTPAKWTASVGLNPWTEHQYQKGIFSLNVVCKVYADFDSKYILYKTLLAILRWCWDIGEVFIRRVCSFGGWFLLCQLLDYLRLEAFLMRLASWHCLTLLSLVYLIESINSTHTRPHHVHDSNIEWPSCWLDQRELLANWWIQRLKR